MEPTVKQEGELAYTEYGVRRWSELLEALDVVDGWVYRGQQMAEWGLQPTVERYSVGISPYEAERKVLHECSRQVHHYLQGETMPATDLELLALIQHFGGPTSLLDWTRSRFVATFFALENATDPDKSCAIWAVNEYWFIYHAAVALKDLGIDAGPLLSEQPNDEMFTTFRNSDAIGVVPMEPYRRNERLAIQQGLFLCPLNMRVSFAQNLASGGIGSEHHVVKIVVSNKLRPEALEHLREMNIGRTTLFPGLEGFIQSLRHLVVLETAEQRKQRNVLKALGPSNPLRDALTQYLQAGTTTIGTESTSTSVTRPEPPG